MSDNFWLIVGQMTDPGTWVGATLLAVIIGAMAWLMGEALHLLVARVAAREGRDANEPSVQFLGQLARVAVWSAAFLSYANLVPRFDKFLDPHRLSGALFAAVVAAGMAWLVGRALRMMIHRLLERHDNSIDQTAVSFLGQLARVGVWIFALFSYARYVPALRDVSTVGLTSVGVISVVVGMAAQNTLGNLISGLSLVLYRPFRLGDHLQVTAPGGQENGIVESVNLGYTVVRTGDERRLVIPNSVMAGQTCVNLSRSGLRAACVIVLTLEHDSDADKARQILLDIARKNTLAVSTPVCRISNISRSGVTITLNAWAANSLLAGDLKSDILEEAKKQFDAANIKIPRDYGINLPPPEPPNKVPS